MVDSMGRTCRAEDIADDEQIDEITRHELRDRGIEGQSDRSMTIGHVNTFPGGHQIATREDLACSKVTD